MAHQGALSFSTIGPATVPLVIYLDDLPLPARAGETVAACLLRSGVDYFRTTAVSGAPRLPYCMIGHCFECLVEIDGVGNQQACLTIIYDGMRVCRQQYMAEVQNILAL